MDESNVQLDVSPFSAKVSRKRLIAAAVRTGLALSRCDCTGPSEVNDPGWDVTNEDFAYCYLVVLTKQILPIAI
jgi:hypothetical protein